VSVQPLSLYFDTEPGRHPDLIVVGRAAIAFSAALHELAYVLDPSLTIRIELQSSTPGSLSLNSLIRTVGRGPTAALAARGLVIGAATWFGHFAMDWTATKIMDELYNSVRSAPEPEMSPQDLERLAAKLDEAMRKRAAEQHVQGVYREVDRDTEIRALGVTTVPGARPDDLVPRAEFGARAGGLKTPEPDTATSRTREDVVNVRLVSPRLVDDERRWKFSFHEGEFGASVKDEGFLEEIRTGKSRLRLISGIVLRVVLQTVEEKEEDVWVVKERTILKVLQSDLPPYQANLTLTPTYPEKGDAGQNTSDAE
jgi:hypothetical protein